jgi:hypothetical protein
VLPGRVAHEACATPFGVVLGYGVRRIRRFGIVLTLLPAVLWEEELRSRNLELIAWITEP